MLYNILWIIFDENSNKNKNNTLKINSMIVF
jgi:hypothetical protein